MMSQVDNTEATPPVAGESVTTERGASGSIWDNLQMDYERLGSFKAVAKLYGVAPETVSRKAKELGVKSRRRWRSENLDPAELRRLYEGGKDAPELAEQFDSSAEPWSLQSAAPSIRSHPKPPSRRTARAATATASSSAPTGFMCRAMSAAGRGSDRPPNRSRGGGAGKGGRIRAAA
jgi:hypothetical protein